MLQKTIIIIVAFTLLFLTSSFAQGYKIDFTVSGLAPQEIYLGYHFGTDRYLKDTTEVDENGKFSFSGDESLPTGIYFLYTPNYYLEFIVADQNFGITTTQAGGYNTMEVTNSNENEVFKEFQLGMISLQVDRKDLLDQLAEAESRQDSTNLYQKINEQDQRASAFRKGIARKYPDTFVSEVIWLMERPEVPGFDDIEDATEKSRLRYEYYKDHYFDHIDLTQNGLLRTPVILKTVNEYLDEIVVQAPDSLIKAIDQIITKVEQDEELFRFWLVTFFTKYQKSNIMGLDAVMVHLAEKYYLSGKANWIGEEDRTKLDDEISFIKPNLIGKKAPRLELLSAELKPLRLADINSPYIVLFFYDPDCGHCKKKTPVLLESYHQMKEKGVEVMGVCTTTDIEKWQKYVKEQNLDWTNAADPYYKSNFRMEYNVRSTPQIYILDKERTIIAKKLDVEQIAEFIERHKKATAMQ